MRILYGKTEELTEEIIRTNRKFLTKERCDRLQNYKIMADKKRCFGAGLLLWYGLHQAGIDWEKADIQQAKNGKPYLKNYENVFFNLSHAGAYVTAVFDGEEVGIDIEEDKRYRRKVADYCFEKREIAYLYEQDDFTEQQKRFGFLWTRKESYMKATGVGLKQDLKSFCVLEPIDGWFFDTFSIGEDYHLSVCTRKSPNVCVPEKINLLEII